MPGKKAIDEKVVIRLLYGTDGTDGLSPHRIVENHHEEICLDKRRTKPFSEQAIRNIKKEAIERGELPSDLAYVATPKQATESRGYEITADIALEVIVEALEAKRELPKIKAELDKYKKGYDNLLETVQLQAKEDKRRKDQEQRFKLAQQQGEIGTK